MKTIFCMALVMFGLNAKAEVAAQKIQQLMENSSVGQAVNPESLKGQYAGVCFSNGSKHIESLYVGSFVNSQMQTQVLPISTEYFYGGSALPEKLQFLLNNDSANFDVVREFVKNGLTGTDNNRGNVAAGEDFKYLYSAALQDNIYVLSVARDYQCKQGVFCNPPILSGCDYGRGPEGFVFQNCVKHNDQLALKKLSDSTLISRRTADAVVKPTNNLSFSLPEVETYCQWNRIN